MGRFRQLADGLSAHTAQALSVRPVSAAIPNAVVHYLTFVTSLK